MVFQQVKLLILSLFRVFRRALCCFSRRRKPSYSEPMDSLQSINVIVEPLDHYGPQHRQNQQYNERDWNSWDDSPRTVEEHIEQYRQKFAKPPTPDTEQPEPDFFKELAPVIKPQVKVYMGEESKQNPSFSRLEAKTDVPIAVNADLEDWVEDDAGGWEEIDSQQTKKMIRDKWREMRHQRQKSSKFDGNDSQHPRQDTNGIGATRLQPGNGT